MNDENTEGRRAQGLPESPRWHERDWARRVFFWSSGVMGALAFYILSIGPAAKVHREVENPAVRGTIETVYAPVVWLVNASDASQSAVLWYVGLWVGGSD